MTAQLLRINYLFGGTRAFTFKSAVHNLLENDSKAWLLPHERALPGNSCSSTERVESETSNSPPLGEISGLRGSASQKTINSAFLL